MNKELVEWQLQEENTGLIYPWWTHPFLEVLKTWDLSKVHWLEFGAGRSTAWLRSKCFWVDTIEANPEWAEVAEQECKDNYFSNGAIYSKQINEGHPELIESYFNLIPKGEKYHIISIDGIYRTEAIEWAIKHFEGRGGIMVIDNLDQDYVWISPKAMELIEPYESQVFIQPNHINHEGKPWNTRWVKIPA